MEQEVAEKFKNFSLSKNEGNKVEFSEMTPKWVMRNEEGT